MWLAHKFEHNFPETDLCYVLRSRVCDLITQALKALPKHTIFEEEGLFAGTQENEELKKDAEIVI
jgi:hypothetical protein